MAQSGTITCMKEAIVTFIKDFRWEVEKWNPNEINKNPTIYFELPMDVACPHSDISLDSNLSLNQEKERKFEELLKSLKPSVPDTVMVNPKTFSLIDKSGNLMGELYQLLERETKCCGEDDIYLEIEIDSDGNTRNINPLKGENLCYIEAIKHLIHRYKWDLSRYRSKYVYVGLEPYIYCTSNRDNTFNPKKN